MSLRLSNDESECVDVNVCVIILIESFHMRYVCWNLKDFFYVLLVILFVFVSCLELWWYEWQNGMYLWQKFRTFTDGSKMIHQRGVEW